jgi:hypothetical protein
METVELELIRKYRNYKDPDIVLDIKRKKITIAGTFGKNE